MASSAIQQLFAHCKQTFAKYSSDKVNKEILSPIISSLNKITKSDICFCPDDFRNREAFKSNPAPVSYMELYRDKTFTLAVFVVKHGSSLPLHDHPNMFGMLKLIHGSIKLVSYNQIEETSVPDSLQPKTENRLIKPVVRNPDKIVSANDGCCVLTPYDGNIHEIQPLTDFSAFLDVLAPSYNGSDSSCHYYQEIEPSLNSEKCWLEETEEPDTYWCDSLPYKGPKLI